MEHIVALSDSVDPGLFPTGRSLIVQADGLGRYFTVTQVADAVAVFDSTGRLIQTIGRRGRGPGEFLRATLVLPGPADSLFVTDERLRRVTVFTPKLELARIIQTPHPPKFANADGTLVVARQIHTMQSAGYPLHRLDHHGQLLLSFGTDTPQYRGDMTRIVNRIAAPARDRAVWTVAPGSYVVEKWHPQTGERVAQYAIRSSWFSESHNAGKPEYERPDPVLVGLWEDAQGIVWVLARVADAQWRPPPVEERLAERPFDVTEYSATYDWILEAFDPTTSTVLASRRFDQYLEHRPPSDLVVSLHSQTVRGTTLDVWRPTLQSTGGSR